MTCKDLAAGKLEGFPELRDGPDGLRQSGFLLPRGLALCTPGVRRWSARRGSAAAAAAAAAAVGGCARTGKARVEKSLPTNLLRVFQSSIGGNVRLFPAGFGLGFKCFTL